MTEILGMEVRVSSVVPADEVWLVPEELLRPNFFPGLDETPEDRVKRIIESDGRRVALVRDPEVLDG